MKQMKRKLALFLAFLMLCLTWSTGDMVSEAAGAVSFGEQAAETTQETEPEEESKKAEETDKTETEKQTEEETTESAAGKTENR